MNETQLSPIDFQLLISKFQKKIKIKRYSTHTEKLYMRYVRDFIHYFRYIDSSELGLPPKKRTLG
jgi:hypothetical protein